MATTYTNKLKLGKPGVADRNWNSPLNANADALDALSPVGGLCVTPAEVPSVSLSVQAAAGRFQKRDGSVGVFTGSPLVTLPPNQSSSLYLTDSAVLTVSASGYPTTSHVPLATVVTNASTVVSVTDDRVVCVIAGTDSRACLSFDGGALNEGAAFTLGTTTGARIGTASNQKLGFWNATPIVRPGTYTQTYTTSTRALGAYTSVVASTAYVGVAAGLTGTPYAQAADLNNLRTAYENLRNLSENTTQVLNALVNDLKAMGLLG